MATVVAVAALLALGLGRGAHAATLTVVNTNDSGAGSLRQAIADAAPGDTINFNPALSGQTITLTTGELLITKNLTISGPAGGITVSGNHSSRVFDISPLQVIANISLLTVANGYPSAGFAGGIYNHGTLTLANSTVSNNTADFGDGGGIYNDGTLTLANSTVSGNRASLGGGIFTNGTLTMAEVTVSDNTAKDGGGIVNYRQMTLTNATVSGNTAEGHPVGLQISGVGGGILNVSIFEVSLTNVTVSGNTAKDSGNGYDFFGDGGGIFNASPYPGNLNLTNTTVSGNTAQSTGSGTGAFGSGGGIFNTGASISLTNSTVSGNTAQGGGSGTGTFGSGGGIFNIGGENLPFSDCCSEVSLTNVTVSGNAAQTGGGIFNAANCCGTVATAPSTPTLNLASTIVAKQLAGMDCSVAGPITSFRYNLDSDGTCNLTGIGDLSNTDPLLAPLTLNPPGMTETQALQPGSPAIDHIPPGTKGCGTTVSTDQRGVSRPQGSRCDIGAYEYVPPPTPTPSPAPVGGIVELPHTGSEPLQAQGIDSDSQTLPVALMGGGVLAFVLGGWFVAKRRRV